MAAQAETGIAERHRDGGRYQAAAEHAEPRQHAEFGEQKCGGVGAEPEIQRMPERDLPAIATEDVPALRQRRVHQRQNHDVLDVDVFHEQRHQGCDRRQTHGHDQIAAAALGKARIHQIDPNRPRGRTNTTNR